MNEKLFDTISELISSFCGVAPENPSPPPSDHAYSCAKEEEELLVGLEAKLSSIAPLPRLSVVILCDDPNGTAAAETASKVFSQEYERFEVFAYDRTCSRYCLLPRANKHIEYQPCDPSGELILLICEGTYLKPHALELFADQLMKQGRPDLMYADSDIKTAFDNAAPFPKPAATPETVLCSDAFTDVLAVSRVLFRPQELACCGTKDLRVLFYRYLQRASSVHHIERTLAAKEYKTPNTFSRDELVAVNKAACMKGTALFNGAYAGSLQFRCNIGKKLRAAIVIPAKADLAMMQACLEAIDTLTTFDRCRIIIAADDEARSGRMHDYLDALRRNKAAAVCYKSGVHSRPELLNIGAEYAYEDRLFFISPDVVVSTPDFSERLIEPLMQKDVAVCGGKLLDRNGLLLHTGTVIGLNGLADSLYRGTPDDKADAVKCFYTAQQRTVSAVSGSFMAVRVDDFRKAGGFDDTLPNLMWDTSLCIRLKEKGLRCMYTPFAEAKSYEKMKVFDKLDKDEQRRCRDVLRAAIKAGDPYYSSRYDRRFLIPRYAKETPALESDALYN